MPKKVDFYTLLGLLRSATKEEIRRAYLKSVKRLHPDSNVAPGETELFLDVQQAYQVLSDPSRKSAYDAALSPEEQPKFVLNQNILLSRNQITRTAESQLVYALLEFSPSEEEKAKTKSAPLNICLALDCSTSMKGEKMDTVKQTAIQLIRKLKPQDIFSIVAFNDKAEVLIPATRQSGSQKLETRIRLLQPSGGTEIFQGLQAAYEETRRYANPKTINHIILLTDGRTYGDEPQCYELASEAAERGIGISGLGIGSEWNDIFLDQVASTTGGVSMLVSQPKDIERLLNEKFTNLSNTFAESLSLIFETSENTNINYAFRLQPETNPILIQNPLQLGAVLRDGTFSVMLEFVVQPPEEDAETVTLLQGQIQIIAANLEMPPIPIPIHMVISVTEKVNPEPPPASLVQALSKLTLYRLQEKARSEVSQGNYDKATEHLQRMATHLLAQGEKSLAKTILMEMQNLEQEKKLSPDGVKAIKYGTRALLLPGERIR